MPKNPKLIDPQSVKEISMTSDFIFMSYSDYWYRDLLRISRHWSSYRRTNVHAEKVVDEWSYKSTNESREMGWNHLLNAVFSLFQSDTNVFETITDTSEFNIRVTLNDGSHLDMKFYGNFASNKLEGLSYAFKTLIPKEETAYPDVLDIIPLFLHPVLITKEVLDRIEEKNICAFMYAEGGAMGCPGEFCALDTEGTKFYIKGFYSGSQKQVGQIEAMEKLFPDFSRLSGIGAPDMNTVLLNKERWMFIYLGMGNHLYLRYDFWMEHGLKIWDGGASKRYRNWKKLIREK